MLIDLHNHTALLSSCSILEPEDLIRKAVAKGLDGLVITEHDLYFDKALLADLQRLAGSRLRLFIGIENTAGNFHILSFGKQLPEGPYPDPESLLFAARGQETALVLAHPWRWGAAASFPSDSALEAFLRQFHAVEVMSANLDQSQQKAGLDFCNKRGIPVCAGSDAHSPLMVATYGTFFEEDIQTETELARALIAGHYSPQRIP